MVQDGFKHISVTAADEEDEVIVAGMGQSGHGGSSPSPAPDSGANAALPPDARPEAPGFGAGAPELRAGSHAQGHLHEEDGYRPTSLDDLKGEPMSAVQKIVIIAAVVCIIGAIAYYLVFMR